jgi:ubiquinone/menaquinone biosynthesis C-methylase UbiE
MGQDQLTNQEIKAPISNGPISIGPTLFEPEPSELKACCAAVYQSEWARLLLGDSFHPGGLALTEHLAALAGITSDKEVLDVAAGTGSTALFLASRFGCRVVGLEYGRDLVDQANDAAAAAGLNHKVNFRQGDAESLPFDDSSFDLIFCECAYCTFPNKGTAAEEFARVLRPGGRLALSDLTRSGPLPSELDSLLAWISCIADAQPVESYISFLESAGLIVELVENQDQALYQTVDDIRGKLLGAELLLKLKKVDLPGVDFEEAKRLARVASEAVRQGKLGYSLFTASST